MAIDSNQWILIWFCILALTSGWHSNSSTPEIRLCSSSTIVLILMKISICKCIKRSAIAIFTHRLIIWHHWRRSLITLYEWVIKIPIISSRSLPNWSSSSSSCMIRSFYTTWFILRGWVQCLIIYPISSSFIVWLSTHTHIIRVRSHIKWTIIITTTPSTAMNLSLSIPT